MTEREPDRPGTSPAGATAYPPSRDRAPAGDTAPDYSDRPVAIRGPESLGGLLLILAGIAAAISLVLDWLADGDISGWGLVRNGFDDLGGIFDDGLWQPLAIVLGGGVLFLLGLMLWLPMKSHRFLGLLALLVSAAVTAGVLVPLADADWDLGFFGPGFWCAIAVAVLGLLGSLKALVSRRRYAR
ncbi:hypothetical protein FHU33_0805 [Blastococcus colisei]|uniref:Uncharacterized protein n=1 Tax=Blastococcus colisei TaxID=1564162 RepID=A0A543PBH6_9ACTN|nr:hypothetical protein [Blastococcus colisei]TQN41437.1 hypothetical protein FHU33_0805 [Blastococcus colisei]